MDLGILEEALGHRFAVRELLAQALTHRSFRNEVDGVGDNQRLEFLGDAVLQLSISSALYEAYGELPEGRLTQLRARLVNGRALADCALRLGLGAYMRLGVGEERTGGRQRASNQADTLEAVLGAVFLDQGYPAATAVIQRLFGDALAGLAPQESRNPKGQLQEWAAQHHRLAPVYTTQGQSGPSHAPEFEVEVRVGDLLAAAGKGGSKQQAQKAAAAEALKALGLLGTAD